MSVTIAVCGTWMSLEALNHVTEVTLGKRLIFELRVKKIGRLFSNIGQS